MWFVLAMSAWASEAWFHPGPGEELIRFDGDQSTVQGLPVRRTGRIAVSAEDPAMLLRLSEVDSVRVLRGSGQVAVLAVRPDVDEIALSRRLHARPDVRWAHPDFEWQLNTRTLPDDPYASGQWHLVNDASRGGTAGVDLRLDAAWAVNAGAGQLIAVLDTGVDLAHPDLSVIGGYDYLGDDDDSSPEGEPHGTACSGAAAGIGNNGLGVAGVAYEADVYGIRLIGGWSPITETYEAFVESIDAGATVVSNSWGFGEGCPTVPLYGAIRDGFDYAEESGRGGLGSAVVFAAGNSDCDVEGDRVLGYNTVVGVAAIDWNDRKEGYSSWGDHIDIGAPSGGILTTDITGPDGYPDWEGDQDYTGWFNGTSASTPLVSGVFALMFAANERLTVDTAREMMCATAVRNDDALGDYDSSGWSKYYGCGRVDAGAAVLAVANEPPTAPVAVYPTTDAPTSRVLLSWEAATDADADRLSYELTWYLDALPEDLHVVDVGTELAYDLTGEVTLGDAVTWSVTAVDSWGAGEVGEEQHFEVVGYAVSTPEPSEPSGCTTAPLWFSWWAGLVALGRRRG